MKLNQSVQKAIGVLRAAALQPGGETASGLARGAGLPWATAVRLVRTLEAEGFLYRMPETDRYVLGFDLIRLGRSGDQGRPMAAMALPALERLAEAVGETVNLTAVHSDGRLEVIEEIDPPRFMRPTSYVGSTYPLHATSIGKLVLATYDEVRLAAFLAEGLPRYTPATIVDPRLLREELARIRERSWSSAVDELEEGLAAVSARVRDVDGELVAMVSVSGPSFRFDEAARAAALEPLQGAGEAIERLIAGEAAGRAGRPQPSVLRK
jgi:DNA-binding IclR family transcriptional regulator